MQLPVSLLISNLAGFILLLTLPLAALSGQAEKNLAERLGHPADAKLLIVHADDCGVAHSVNAATMEALTKGSINSASIMVPCPWFPEIAGFSLAEPRHDFGLHLTLTAEWAFLKWDGVLPANEIPSLISEEGYFFPDVPSVVTRADPREVSNEIRAQIDRAIKWGLKPTHLDSHMGVLFSSPEFFKIYLALGKEYNIPVLYPRQAMEAFRSEIPDSLLHAHPAMEGVIIATPEVADGKWAEYYHEQIKKLKPGLNELIIHLAYDDDEMQAVTIDHPDYGSAWRQRDLDYVNSPEFKQLLKDENITLVTWRDIQEAYK